MILDGSLFGPVGGALLSFAGSEAAALLGFAIGRRGGPALARSSSPAARARAERMVAQHGAIAIVVTRPVPVVAETAALLAGATAMPLRSFGRGRDRVESRRPSRTRSSGRTPRGPAWAWRCSPP